MSERKRKLLPTEAPSGQAVMMKYLCKPSRSSQPHQGSESVSDSVGEHPGAEAGATAQSLSAADDGNAAGLSQEPGGVGEDSSVEKSHAKVVSALSKLAEKR